MNIASEIFQKNYEDVEWFQEELVYYFEETNEWKSEVWKFNRNQDGDIETTELVEEKSYPRGSKPILEEKFPWLKHNKKWKPYKPKRQPYGS
tara:strand:- start:195 stop:470 length:276 start_codon:yes stop_codon:yes gene_type:complete